MPNNLINGGSLADQSASLASRNIGILSIAAYFPKTYVNQSDLEVYDKVDSGKYTKGLMQDKMGFCTDLEDINSISMTVTKKLIEQSGVSLNDIGYLEVGTETIVDKSKSVKTVLMELFQESGNTDIEGVDTTNACYGGTAALFHAIDHCSSPYWDGRLAIVIAADIAVYDKGNARPTGGCGAIAMLIGPNAPLVFGINRATHMQHVYDFYKPDPHSEYPTVDGKLSLQAYISAVDKCYQNFRKKLSSAGGKQQVSGGDNKVDQDKLNLLDKFDAILFHSPYCKLVRKAFARLLFDEYNYKINSSPNGSQEIQDDVKLANRFKGFAELPRDKIQSSYDDWSKPIDEAKNSLEKVALKSSEQLYQDKTQESLFLANQVGNMYTASLYSCLVSYLTSKQVDQLIGREVLFFSYGSGCASSMFSARLTKDIQALRKLLLPLKDVRNQLNDRLKVTPEEFSAHLEHRKLTFNLPNRAPTGQPSAASFNGLGSVKVQNYLYPGTYYLTSIDQMFRRQYTKLEAPLVIENNNNNYESSCIMTKKPIQGQNHVAEEQKQTETV